MSSFSCHTGRYCSTAGDVIVFKVDPDGDDDATIKTESHYPESDSGRTITSERTQNSRPLSQYGVSTHRVPSQYSRPALSTFSRQPESIPSTISTSPAPRAATTIAVNENHDDDNYNILLRQKDHQSIPSSHVYNVQTGKYRLHLNNSYNHLSS